MADMSSGAKMVIDLRGRFDDTAIKRDVLGIDGNTLHSGSGMDSGLDECDHSRGRARRCSNRHTEPNRNKAKRF